MKNLPRILWLVSLSCMVLVIVSITLLVLKKVWLSGDSPRKGHVAVIDIRGLIWDAESVVKEIEEVVELPSLKALVIRLDTPGGLVGPSQEIYRALRRVDAKRPVVISMGSAAASGGYYIALGGRKLFANPGTLTASIGVIMEFANTEKLYRWAKVERYALKSGRFNDIGSTSRVMTPQERELLQALITDIHTQFASTIKERRGLSQAEVDSVADGRVMSGFQAKRAKLIDELGGLQEAVEEAKKMAGLPEDAYVRYQESKRGVLWQLFFGDSDRSGSQENLLKDFLRNTELIPGIQVMLLSPVR